MVFVESLAFASALSLFDAVALEATRVAFIVELEPLAVSGLFSLLLFVASLAFVSALSLLEDFGESIAFASFLMNVNVVFTAYFKMQVSFSLQLDLYKRHVLFLLSNSAMVQFARIINSGNNEPRHEETCIRGFPTR